MPRITLDPEFSTLCPKPTDEELATLEKSLLDEGCRDPITFWKTKGNPLLDGYNRRELCQKNDLKCPARGINLPDRHAAICWILSNQLGRRNLTDAQRTIAMGRLYNEQKAGQGGDKKSKGQNVLLIDNAAVIAESQGVNEKTVKRAGEVAKAVDALAERSPDLAQAVQAGTIPLSSAAALAEAPMTELQKLEKTAGPKLRKAAQAAAHKAKAKKSAPKSGTTKNDPKLWTEIEASLGKALNRTDELNRAFPHDKMHKQLLGEIKVCMGTLKEWKRAVR